MRKKILLSLCFFLLYAILAGTRTSNAQEISFTVTPSYVEIPSPGQTATVNITVTNAPVVDFWMVNVTWDPAVLSIPDPNLSLIHI